MRGDSDTCSAVTSGVIVECLSLIMSISEKPTINSRRNNFNILLKLFSTFSKVY